MRRIVNKIKILRVKIFFYYFIFFIDNYKVEVLFGYFWFVEFKLFMLWCLGIGLFVLWIKDGWLLDDR